MSEFNYIPGLRFDILRMREKLLLEIAYQLKRIADNNFQGMGD